MENTEGPSLPRNEQENLEKEFAQQSKFSFSKYLSIKSLIIISIVLFTIITALDGFFMTVGSELGRCYRKSANFTSNEFTNSQLTSEQKCSIVKKDAVAVKTCENDLAKQLKVPGVVPVTKLIGKIMFGDISDDQSNQMIDKYCSEKTTVNSAPLSSASASTIYEAVDKGIPTKCDITSNKDNVKYSIYTKNYNLYIEAKVINSTDKVSYLIIDANTAWNWDKDNNEGVKTTISPQGQERDGLILTSLWNLAEDKELYKNSCKENIEISDSLFIPPPNITFTDLFSKQQELVREMETDAYNSKYQKLYKELVYGEKPIVSTSAKMAFELSKTKSIICLRNKNGSPTAYGTSYFMSGKLRFEGGNIGLFTERDAIGIYNSNTLWTWNAGSIKGIKLEPSSTLPADQFLEHILEGLDKDSLLCYEYLFLDGLFNVPSDVSFEMQ